MEKPQRWIDSPGEETELNVFKLSLWADSSHQTQSDRVLSRSKKCEWVYKVSQIIGEPVNNPYVVFSTSPINKLIFSDLKNITLNNDAMLLLKMH